MKASPGFGLLVAAVLLASGGLAALALLQPAALGTEWLGAVGAIGLAVLLVLVHIIQASAAAKAQAEKRQREAEIEGRQRDAAIVRLLDGITSLADGDLTGEIQVTEDFTGSLADSLNFTVQTLRDLVGTINSTTEKIGTAASATSATSQQMSQASEGQAQDIVLATQAIHAASTSLEEMAANAENVAAQAKSSVEVAHNGAATVGRTIAGMSNLREQIGRMVNDLIATSRARIAEADPQSADDVRAAGRPLIGFSDAMASEERTFKRYMYANLYHHPHQLAVAEQARDVVAGLAGSYRADPSLLPDGWRDRLPADEPARGRHVADFIAGMTDRYAIARYREVVGPVEMPEGF